MRGSISTPAARARPCQDSRVRRAVETIAASGSRPFSCRQTPRSAACWVPRVVNGRSWSVAAKLSAVAWRTTTSVRRGRVVMLSGSHGVETAVDMHDLAGRRREEVGEQRHDRTCGRRAVGVVPAQGCPLGPGRLELLEARDRLGGEGLQRTGGDEVDPDAAGTEVAGEI